MRRSIMVRSMAVALAAVMLVTGTALGGTKLVSVLNVWGTMGVWGTHANFFAQWKASQFHAEGKVVWLIENLDMDGVLQNGKDCTSDICVAWMYGATAKFYNSAGALVASLALPTDNCYASAYSTRDRAFSECKRYGYEVPIAATTMKLSWSIGVQRRDGLWLNAWTATKTVTLATT